MSTETTAPRSEDRADRSVVPLEAIETKKEAALAYARRGIPVLPIQTIREERCTCGDPGCSSPGKHPIGRLAPSGLHSATTDARTIEDRWQAVPSANIGLATGEASGLLVLDVDPKDGGEASLTALEERYEPLPETLAVRTGGGGRHLYFQYPENVQITISAGELGDGLDVRGNGGYVVAPPSGHISGTPYEWTTRDPPSSPPDWLIREIRQGPQKDRAEATSSPTPEIIPEGRRNDRLTSIGGRLRAQGLELEEIEATLQQVNRHRCRPPLSEQEVRLVAESLARYEPGTLPGGPKAKSSRAQTAGNAETARLHLIEEPPRIPEDTYDLLPDVLSEPARHLEAPYERDVFLLSVLPVLAGGLPNACLKYGRQWQALNLFVYLVAPTGAGKATARLGRQVGTAANARMIEESRARRKRWTARMDNENEEAGPKPPFRRLLIGPDTTAAGLKEAIRAYPHAVIHSTEARTVGIANSREFGHFEDGFLKSFHQEPITIDRKSEEPVQIESPALSIGLTGTPGSVAEVVGDPETGLFSRFLWYYFESPPVWIDQFADDRDRQLEKKIGALGELLDGVQEVLAGREEPLYVRFGEGVRAMQNEIMERIFHQCRQSEIPEEFVSNVKRGGLIAARIAGILALVSRTSEGADLGAGTRSIAPSSDDMEAALRIVATGLDHAIALFQMSRRRDAGRQLSTKKRKLLADLPAEFETAEARSRAEDLEIPERTLYSHLKTFCEKGLLEKIEHGRYRKPAMRSRCSSCISCTLAAVEELEGEPAADLEPRAGRMNGSVRASKDERQNQPPTAAQTPFEKGEEVQVRGTDTKGTVRYCEEGRVIVTSSEWIGSRPFDPSDLTALNT